MPLTAWLREIGTQRFWLAQLFCVLHKTHPIEFCTAQKVPEGVHVDVEPLRAPRHCGLKVA